MSGVPDFALGTTIDFKFTTRRFTTGAPFALASGTISAYVDNSTTQITAGITLSADFDGVTGLNNVRVVLTSGNGYAAGTCIDFVITVGTVDSVSVVGEVVYQCTIEKQSALKPTTAGRTLDVSAAGNAGIDWANVENPTTALNLSGTNIDVDQIVASVSGAVGSVTGAVGSVTGNVGGNVTGSVGSVAGAVGSVTGNVGGNVAGSVGSVVGNVGGDVVGSVASVTAAVAITSNVKKNTASAGFAFVMTSDTTHAPTAGLTVTAERSIDGAALGACANAVVELSNGIYVIDLAAADVNGNHIMLRFTATGADDRLIEIITQP